MTNKERLIELLCEKLPGVNAETVTKVFDIVRERDWAEFCSYMADDKDHPEERVAANRTMNEKIDELVAVDPGVRNVADTIIKELNGRYVTEADCFYRKVYHALAEDYVC